jgi:hypothetical protein
MAYATPPPSAHKRFGVRAAPAHSHGAIPESRHLPKKKIVKRSNAPASCFFSDSNHTYSNKRRRAAAARESTPDANPEPAEPESDSNIASDKTVSENTALPSQDNTALEPEQPQPQPLTPKRSRIAPEQLPLGLEASDFHSVHQRDPELQQQLEEQKGQGTGVERNKDGELWSLEDDKILLELVLAKIKLNPSEWDECASVMGRDGRSLDRRWKTLIEHRQVRVSSQRSKLHSTWRWCDSFFRWLSLALLSLLILFMAWFLLLLLLLLSILRVYMIWVLDKHLFSVHFIWVPRAQQHPRRVFQLLILFLHHFLMFLLLLLDILVF